MIKKYYLFFLLIIISFGCSKDKIKPKINTSINIEKLPTQESWNSTIFFTDSGITKAILYAGHLSVFENKQETILDDNVKINFYDHFKHITTTLTSKRGRVDDVTKDLYAIDSVVVISDKGTVVRTEELLYKDSNKKIVSDKFVTIITKTETIKGYGFESDQDLQNYVVYNITFISNNDTTNKK